MSSRKEWRRVKFGDVVRQVKDTADPETSGLERYVAGEHMDTDELQITRWGTIGDGYLGPAFHRRFSNGQVLYGSRRTYLRKVALADFGGICANTTLVCDTKDPTVLLPELLPFVMQTESFHAHSISQSKGSVNPYINWPDLAWYEFDLPPIDEQHAIASALTALETRRRAGARELIALRLAKRSAIELKIRRLDEVRDVSLDEVIQPGRPITYGIVKPGPHVEAGVPVIKVKDYPSGAIAREGLRRTSAEIDESYHRSRLADGDLIISIRGTIGRLAEIPPDLAGANITQDTARLSVAAAVNRQFVLLVLESEFVQRQLKKLTTGLAVRGINIGALRKVRLPLPDPAQQVEAVALKRELEEAEIALITHRTYTDRLRNDLLYHFMGG
jgi:type I restriction enzyme S subunit